MIFLLDPNNFLMTTKKSTSHDALRIALVDFFCKDIKICFFAGDRHWMSHTQGHTEIARSELRTAKNHLLEEDYELLANRLAVEANMM